MIIGQILANTWKRLLPFHLFFNSNYHRKAFLDALPAFLDQFPDYPLHDLVPKIAQKSEVLYLGLDLDELEKMKIPSHSETQDSFRREQPM